jgi:hypothetical protein
MGQRDNGEELRCLERVTHVSNAARRPEIPGLIQPLTLKKILPNQMHSLLSIRELIVRRKKKVTD